MFNKTNLSLNFFSAGNLFKYPLLYLSVFFIVLSGCSRYQYVYINSDLAHDEKKVYYAENDSVKISYKFEGLNCPVSIGIFNKLPVPLYVDWKRSAVIVDSLLISYWSDEANIDASLANGEADLTDYLTLDKGKLGSIRLAGQVSFIAPYASIEETHISLQNSFLTISSLNPARSIKLPGTSGQFNGKLYLFSKEDSPLRFRSFLTLSTAEDFSDPVYFDHSFWVSEIVETMTNPSAVTNKSSNQFYVTKATGFGEFSGFVGGTLLLAGVVAAVVIWNDDPGSE